ncbi:transaldolase family protein [Actinopolyspora mortivallis]|uniref:transaldolase family protein n=1 Tax=Actinopolyspora mortivallis TaxID=33906 RepID=UPI000362A215|nr:transaldolase family protein [Actinopolyspora mortivallis]
MIIGPENDLLDRLTAEGVTPWLVGDVRGTSRVPEGIRTTLSRHSWLGALLRTDATSHTTVREVCDALRHVHEASAGRDGYVSAAVLPCHAHETEALVDTAAWLHATVDRPNLLVRIPATEAGIHAYRKCLARGIGVHSTCVLSPERYRRVLEAHVVGSEQAMAASTRLHRITAVASLPVGLVDAEVNRRLDALRTERSTQLRDRAGTALARLAYRVRETRLDGWWWRVLRAAGARPPRLLWTTLRARHVSRLIGWNTAQALSPSVLESAARHHPPQGDTMLETHTRAQHTLEELCELGVDLRAVFDDLENRCFRTSESPEERGLTDGSPA